MFQSNQANSGSVSMTSTINITAPSCNILLPNQRYDLGKLMKKGIEVEHAPINIEVSCNAPSVSSYLTIKANLLSSDSKRLNIIIDNEAVGWFGLKDGNNIYLDFNNGTFCSDSIGVNLNRTCAIKPITYLSKDKLKGGDFIIPVVFTVHIP